MINKKQLILISSILIAMFMLAACGNGDDDSSNGSSDSSNGSSDSSDSGSSDGSSESNSGGELNIALNAQPPTLDPTMSTATATRDTARLVFESLMVLNAAFEPVPFLAEDVEVQDDKIFTFYLREGVTFHNGDEMKAEDVVASMNRWKANSNKGMELIGDNEFVEIDEYTVEVELPEAYPRFLSIVASSGQFAAIMPKALNEEAGPEGVSEYIGTGPFEFVEWQQDNFIHFTKYDDYVGIEGEMDGLAGKKEALVDDVYFYIASDASTRQAGIQSGEYDIAYQLPFDSYQQLLTTDLQVSPALAGNMVMVYNTEDGLVADKTIRQAINAALNIDEILQASLVDPEIYASGPSLMEEDNVAWATDAGGEYYNQNDPALAEELLAEAGYDGEVVTIVSTRDYQHYYDASVVIQQQLENIGMNVELEVYDWPTLTDLVKEPSEWNLRVNGFTFNADPTQILYLDSNYAGVSEDATLEESKRKIEHATSAEEGKAEWEFLQEYLWSDLVPSTKLGSYSHLYVLGENVNGFIYSHGGQYWNVSVD